MYIKLNTNQIEINQQCLNDNCVLVLDNRTQSNIDIQEINHENEDCILLEQNYNQIILDKNSIKDLFEMISHYYPFITTTKKG